MEVRIQAIHFEIAERLTAFINKKAERLTRHNPSIAVVDVTLKVVKPETAMNKEAIIKINTPQHDALVFQADGHVGGAQIQAHAAGRKDAHMLKPPNSVSE